jgi:hypothetical protein
VKKQSMSVAEYVASIVGFSGKSNAQISEEIGYGVERANFVSMIRTGRAKIPISKVSVFAKSVGVDPVHMLRLVMREYSPETYEALEPFLTSALTEGETQVLNVMRKEAQELPIALDATELVQLQSFAKAAHKRAKDQLKVGKLSSDKNFTVRGTVSPLAKMALL